MDIEQNIHVDTLIKDSVTKFEWTRAANEVRGLLQKYPKICDRRISKGYLIDALRNNNIILLGQIMREQYGKAKYQSDAFVIANETSVPGFIYVDIICSVGIVKGFGDMLLDEAMKIAKRKNLQGVALSALPHVIGYYRERGFRHREDCSPEEAMLFNYFETEMKPLITKYKKDVANHWMDKVEGQDFRRYLQRLILENLGALHSPPECKKPFRTMPTIDVLNECLMEAIQSGFVMTKCANDHGPSVSSTGSFSARTKKRSSSKRMASSRKRSRATGTPMTRKRTSRATTPTTATPTPPMTRKRRATATPTPPVPRPTPPNDSTPIDSCNFM
jgi:hypothetical protein